MNWRKRHNLPYPKRISADGWCVVAMIWAAIILVIAGATVMDAVGGPSFLKGVYLFKHHGW